MIHDVISLLCLYATVVALFFHRHGGYGDKKQSRGIRRG